ncbi:hypothetical protein [Pseudoxanthomonas winnipegensis]|uniref:Uncharacterized protein n=1 Tax=Pseudoxanthomonas winnipegensis TaxID=2480810 RepID=A0A4Q8M6S8_9GAMM|nr:hypothetical protein [Pseudoxanthomonas winnipegensis]TAA43539.1 hypothetical protein EA655_09755 [Pseudoxanthomonas winnipegensis]
MHADYFDRSSALLRTVGAPGPDEPYELQAIRPGGGLVSREFTSAPIALQELLDHLVQEKSFNEDPKIDGLIYVHDNHALPVLGPTRCASDRQGIRLFRVSRAAVQQSTGIALVFVTTTFCDGKPGLKVARLKRVQASWEVEELRWI